MIPWWWLVVEAVLLGAGVAWALRHGRTFGLYDAVMDPMLAQIELHQKHGAEWRCLRP